MCFRVDPTKTLQELMPTICDERGVELSNHSLRLATQPEDPLDMSQTLEKSGAIEFLLVDLKGQPAGTYVECMHKEEQSITTRILLKSSPEVLIKNQLEANLKKFKDRSQSPPILVFYK